MTDLRQRIEAELLGNILPFWMAYTVDEECGGFYGALSNERVVNNAAPRSAVLTARILWTYSAAYRLYQDDRYLRMARHAYAYLTQKFWDRQYGGVYWTLDRDGNPINDRKHVYAQAFAIYGLTEFYRATGEPCSLQVAQELFALIETHSFDPVFGGNIECCSRAWGPLEDMRLSDKELPQARKSMNTLLHLMEAYTNLRRVWPAEELKIKQRGLIEIFLQTIVDPQTHHFKLFFDEAWQSLNDHISPGHDIEGSWLLVEAAEVQGEAALLARTRTTALDLAEAVKRYLDDDGALNCEATPGGIVNDEKHWWVQAEGLVGFYNAYQLSGRADFAQIVDRLWQQIEIHFVDHTFGDWLKVLDRTGAPLPQYPKTGPWECPYHHSRACFELLSRLPK